MRIWMFLNLVKITSGQAKILSREFQDRQWLLEHRTCWQNHFFLSSIRSMHLLSSIFLKNTLIWKRPFVVRQGGALFCSKVKHIINRFSVVRCVSPHCQCFEFRLTLTTLLLSHVPTMGIGQYCWLWSQWTCILHWITLVSDQHCH